LLADIVGRHYKSIRTYAPAILTSRGSSCKMSYERD
jgi:hypothetical protein